MKVVLFCGGFGMRLRDYSDSIPKPMVHIGDRPILLHIMQYYAHFGHRDFILCLGWKADCFREYFSNLKSPNITPTETIDGGLPPDALRAEVENWNITFCDTGTTSSIGERLAAVQPHLASEETFLANYADGLCDVDLTEMIRFHHQNGSVATFLSTHPTQSFHTASIDESGRVEEIKSVGKADIWMNGGFFVLSNSIFNYLRPGEDMIDDAFGRLIAERKCFSVKHKGFWGCMDTYKEMQMLREMHHQGNLPWAVWERRAEQDVQVMPLTPSATGESKGE